MSETLQLRGTLRGHNGWVTQIATNPKYPDMILSCSRGKCNRRHVCGLWCVIIWMGWDSSGQIENGVRKWLLL